MSVKFTLQVNFGEESGGVQTSLLNILLYIRCEEQQQQQQQQQALFA